MTIRRATLADVPGLTRLIERSVRSLQRGDYTPVDIERALASVYGVDTLLISDGTYYVIELGAELVACGGWSKRATLHGGDHFAGPSGVLLDPRTDAAKIRAFFVAPAYARRGSASRLLSACGRAARAAGFRRAELGATLAGVPFYKARGYTVGGTAAVSLGGGESPTGVPRTRVSAARLGRAPSALRSVHGDEAACGTTRSNGFTKVGHRKFVERACVSASFCS